jgi:hypothetical protein
MREIAGASGYLSQGPLTASFGLGTAATVDTLEVTWPASGIVQTFTDVACNQRLEIVEIDQSGIPDEKDTPTVFRLYPGRPNPFSISAMIRYDLPRRSRVSLKVYDASGRLVRRIIGNRLSAPGNHTATWNGRNQSGQPVAPGLYFARLTAGDQAQTQPIVLMR